MSRPRDIESLLDQWFASGPDDAPAAAVERALQLVGTTPQAAPLVGRTARWRPAVASNGWSLRLALAVALLVGLVIALVGLSGARPTTLTFVSERYGFEIRHPAEWVVRHAGEDWGVTDPWDDPSVADTFADGGVRFSVVSIPVIGQPIPLRWASVFVPERPVLAGAGDDRRCVDPNGGPPIRLTNHRGWEAARVAGVAAVIRVACGYVDAVAMLGRRAYVISTFTGRQAGADLEQFDAFTQAVKFRPDMLSTPAPATVAPPTASPSGGPEPDTEVFLSPLYGYRLEHPGSWTISAATVPWTGTEPRDGPPTADRIGTPAPITIVSLDMPPEMTVEAWLGDHLPPPAAFSPPTESRLQGRCGFGGISMPALGDASWSPSAIGGRPAFVRAVCGQVDAVLPVGERVVVLGAFTGRQPGGDVDRLTGLVDRLTLDEDDDPSAIAPSMDPNATVSFTLMHGYRASVPWRLTRSPATMPLPELTPVRSYGQNNRYDRFARGFQTILASSSPVDGNLTLDDVVASLPLRQESDVPGPNGYTCRGAFGTYMALPPEHWRRTRIGDVPARERDSCEFIDVVAVVGGRAYIFTARSLNAAETPPAGRAYLDAFLASVEFLPETAVDDP